MSTRDGKVLGRIRSWGLWVGCVLAVVMGGAIGSARADPAFLPRTAGIFADQVGTEPSFIVTPFVPFNIYVLGFGLGDLRGYEMQITGLEGITVLGVTILPVGAVNGGTQTNWIVDVGGCVTTEPIFRFGSLQVIALAAVPADRAVCLRPSEPSSFQGVFAGYLSCDDVLQPLALTEVGCGVYPSGCLILNATFGGGVLPSEAGTWGGVKVRYGQN